MSQLTQPAWVPKEKSPKLAIRYQSRVVHELDHTQKGVTSPLSTLKKTTGNFIQYMPVGKLGVTLACIDPILKQILGVGKKGEIDDTTRRDFEAELNSELGFLDSQKVTLDNPSVPFELYGRQKNRLGINLSTSAQLLGERVLVEKHIRREYPTTSSRFEDNLLDWDPHITIGFVRPEYLTRDEIDDLHGDPSGFIIGKAVASAEADHERFGVENIADQIVFPDSLVLGGLGVVCNKLARGAF